MRISTTDIFQRAVDNLSTQQLLLMDIQSKISTGKQTLTPAEDPIGALKTLNYQYEINDIQQWMDNTVTAVSYLEYEESVFDTVTNIYQRMQELTIYAGNASLASTDRQSIAIEMKQMLQELISLVNSQSPNGEYLFSGYKINTPPVGTDVNGNYIFQGDEGQRTIMLAENLWIEVTDSGKPFFFNIPTNRLQAAGSEGIATLVSASNTLVNAGSLIPLQPNDLIINDIAIGSSVSDGLSTTDSASSAIALTNAINNQSAAHQVFASANPTVIDLGIYTASPLTTNQLSINHIDIIDAIGTQASLIDSINNQSTLTGVIASQPGGAGTAMVLTAVDGRNIQLQTNGLATATFANFNLSGGALDKVMKSTITLSAHISIDITGNNVGAGGFIIEQQPLSVNTGTGNISAPLIVDATQASVSSYSIVFNNPPTTFNIVSDLNPQQVLPGFANMVYVPNQAIEFNGIKVQITGVPNAGDSFGVNARAIGSQDIFTTIQNIINTLENISDPIQLNSDIGVGLTNLAFAQESLSFARAKIGARLNTVDNQKNYQDLIMLISQKKLSEVADLDYNDAITKLSQYHLILQAAQQSFVRIQSLSLFNYLR